MKDRTEIPVPAHLQELLEPTPSGAAKLIAAWDGLTPETQISILAAKKKHPGPAYLYHQIIDKALTSDNAFVRYMAAREIHHLWDRDQREKDLRAQINNDPVPLVRYAPLETDFGLSDRELDPEKFFALPHEARLAKVRRLTGSGEEIAKLISYAVEHQLKDDQVSEIELFEILADYLNKPEFKARYVEEQLGYDGFSRYQSGKDIKALWELVLKVPEDLSYVIIEHLPEGTRFWGDIPEHVLDGMSDRQLRTLFDRPDVGLEKFRKQKFFEVVEEDDEKKDYARDFMQSAATTHAFDLTNEEFAEILSKPDKPRVRILERDDFNSGHSQLPRSSCCIPGV